MSMVTIQQFIAAILVGQAATPDDARSRALAGCEAMGINPKAVLPVIDVSGGGSTKGNANPDDVNVAEFVEYMKSGGKFSDRATPTRYWKADSRRFCHMAVGGCGVAERENVALRFALTKEGSPKLQYENGREYGPTLHPECLERLLELAGSNPEF